MTTNNTNTNNHVLILNNGFWGKPSNRKNGTTISVHLRDENNREVDRVEDFIVWNIDDLKAKIAEMAQKYHTNRVETEQEFLSYYVPENLNVIKFDWLAQHKRDLGIA